MCLTEGFSSISGSTGPQSRTIRGCEEVCEAARLTSEHHNKQSEEAICSYHLHHFHAHQLHPSQTPTMSLWQPLWPRPFSKIIKCDITKPGTSESSSDARGQRSGLKAVRPPPFGLWEEVRPGMRATCSSSSAGRLKLPAVRSWQRTLPLGREGGFEGRITL